MIYVTRIYKLNDIQHILYSEGTRKFSIKNISEAKEDLFEIDDIIKRKTKSNPPPFRRGSNGGGGLDFITIQTLCISVLSILIVFYRQHKPISLTHSLLLPNFLH